MGFLGAATRVRLFLTLYFIGVTFTILFTIGGGTYSVLAVKSKQASWAEIDVQRWTASSDADKALAQYVVRLYFFPSFFFFSLIQNLFLY